MSDGRVLFLTLDELLVVAERALGAPPVVRDAGLLESAVARPRASVAGADAYPALAQKAAAFVHSLVRNQALVDGNKRLGLAGLIVFLGINGQRLTLANGEAYGLIVAIADGRLDEVDAIAERIGGGSEAVASGR